MWYRKDLDFVGKKKPIQMKNSLMPNVKIVLRIVKIDSNALIEKSGNRMDLEFGFRTSRNKLKATVFWVAESEGCVFEFYLEG